MRVKTFCAFLLALVMGFSCVEDEIELDAPVFEASELSFVSNKSNLSLESQVLGVRSFKDGFMEQSNHFVFTLQAEKSLVNGRILDFDATRVSLVKTGFKKYEVTADLKGIGFTRLSSDLSTLSTTLMVGNTSYVGEQLAGLKNEHHLALVIMVALLNDIIFDQPFSNSSMSNTRIQCGYYGYTIGWGWTQEQAVDHESCVRDSACETIQRYSCEYLGSSTSCGFGAIGCVTISTFRCDDGKACS